jgi:hypothetical protein
MAEENRLLETAQNCGFNLYEAPSPRLRTAGVFGPCLAYRAWALAWTFLRVPRPLGLVGLLCLGLPRLCWDQVPSLKGTHLLLSHINLRKQLSFHFKLVRYSITTPTTPLIRLLQLPRRRRANTMSRAYWPKGIPNEHECPFRHPKEAVGSLPPMATRVDLMVSLWCPWPLPFFPSFPSVYSSFVAFATASST